MKKAISTLALALGLAGSASAVVKVGDIAPNFTLKDIDGNPHNLYSYLDSGYAVIIDVSAAWCGPCWSAHNSHVFDNLVTHYGKNGTITPGKVKVLFIEGESANTTAQLHGTSSGSTTATFSQGDWVAGTNYPIIDDASQNSNYLSGGYPTFTVICRDRIVNAVVSGYGSAMGAESYWLNIIDAGCPNYPPSSTIDVKAVPYSGSNFYSCSATPTVKFQNYSATQNVTSASVKVFSGSTQVATASWSGTLAPYAIGSISVPSFSPTQFAPYRFEVTTSGDSYTANDKSKDSLFKVYSASTANAVPWSENFETSTADGTLPYKLTASDPSVIFAYKGTSSTVTGSDGKASRAAVILNGYYTTPVTFMLGSFNTASLTNAAIDFDYAYAQIVSSNDKLEVMVSKDCGATWATVWSKSGSTLSTASPVNGEFIPNAASQWSHASALLTPYKSSSMLVKLVATSNNGNYTWVDNFKITNSLSVNNVISSEDVKLFPNPAKEFTTLEFTLAKANAVTVTVVDGLGRTVSTIANGTLQQGQQRLSIPTAALAAGVYTINIQTEEGSLTQRLSVVK